MPIKQKVEEQLYRINYERNKNIWIPHLVVLFLSFYFQREKIMTFQLWWVALLVVVVGLFLRILVFRRFYEQYKASNKWVLGLNDFGVFILAIGWILHFCSIFYSYGVNSQHSSNSIIIIAGMITGATVSSVANLRSFHILSGTMCFFLTVLYVFTPESDKLVAGYVAIFYVFNAYHISLSRRQLSNSIEAELVARTERDRVTRIINTVPGYVAVFNKELICINANGATLAAQPDAIGKKLGTIEPGSAWEKYLLDFIESERPRLMSESHFTIDGKEHSMLRNAQRTEDQGAILASLDITELVVAKNRIREQEAKAIYTAKLASLGEMAAGIAHEINNPLTVVHGSASVIGKLIEIEPLDKASIKLLTTKLVDTSIRISKTIKSLKSLSRNGDNDPYEEVDLAKILDQCKDICQMRCEKNEVQLKLPSFDEPVRFTGREVQIYQVLMNLINNAIDAVKDCKDPWIEVKYVYKPDSLEIYVVDSGPGVPVGIREKIMQPFFTTKDVNHGTGLGLSISKSIMAAHRGDLALVEGKHTTFRIYLPIEETADTVIPRS